MFPDDTRAPSALGAFLGGRGAARPNPARPPEARSYSLLDASGAIREGVVRYDGWARVVGRSPRALDALHALVLRACQGALSAWGWCPDSLTVSFHPRGGAAGRAYGVGLGGDRRISVGVEVLAEYGDESVVRLVLHELCHHAREELVPRPWVPGQGHDPVFCRMLGEADPVVRADPARCERFTDTPEPGAIEATLDRAATRGVRFEAAAGILRVGFDRHREGRFRWDPVPGQGRWRSVWAPMYVDLFAPFLRRFPRAERPAIRVRHDPRPFTTETFGGEPLDLSLEAYLARLVARHGPDGGWTAPVLAAFEA